MAGGSETDFGGGTIAGGSVVGAAAGEVGVAQAKFHPRKQMKRSPRIRPQAITSALVACRHASSHLILDLRFWLLATEAGSPLS